MITEHPPPDLQARMRSAIADIATYNEFTDGPLSADLEHS